ncbi:MAG: DUF3488 domain-containing protein [Verrucomicrobia bacterium]|nr:DUF3488 domain-containing protein [Verrucomicrobiota bacterium]
MSTETKPPPLSLDELAQLKWLLGGVLTLLGVWTVSYMDVEAWELVILTTLVAGACVWWPTLPARVPALMHTLAFPLIVAFFVGDLWLTGSILPAMVRLDILLLLYRTASYRQRRDDLQIIVLGLFLIVVAGVLTVSLAFAAQILVYTGCALLFLLTITLVDAAHGNVKAGIFAPVPRTVPGWATHADWPRLFRRLHDVADARVVVLAVALFAGVVAISAVLFMAIPRFQLENSLFLERFVTKKAKSGFNDSIRIGDVTEIQQDTGIALSVDVSDRSQAPGAPYWRMLVLDDYTEGVFRLSPRLRMTAFGARERTGASALREPMPKLGAGVVWTFFLESGVSRYLPFPGRWERVQFRESQNFRLAPDLGLLALREEPVTMTAYRVEGVEISPVIPDPSFARRWKAANDSDRRHGGLQSTLNVNVSDTERLRALADEITGGAAVAAGDFIERAGAWLRERHSYALSPVIPRGTGDPLVRWMTSREAGHCELFAGSLVLLARAAGFPARVVTGFRGGTWNAYSNNFTVRHSDAHAWTEIFDPEIGAWRRTDALAAPEVQRAAEQTGEAALARRADSSWKARLDSLRVFWYRRIVSFDQQSQTETLRNLKAGAQRGGQQLREALARAAAAVRAWFGGPWDARRVAVVVGWIALNAGVVWLVQRGRIRFRHWRSAKSDDPVRADASRWLRRLGECPVPTAECAAVRGELQRLRFGARVTWPEPEGVFRRARRALREARRERRPA